MGGTATEQDGPFGTELVCVVPMQLPDGQPGTQVSRISGHEGPNWLLRATLMGQPAAEPESAGPWEETIRSVVVRRGREAMAPGCAAAADAAARRASGRLIGVTPGSPPSDYARRMAEHKDGLRATISRWASQDRDEARELRKDTAQGRPGRDQRRARPPAGHRAGHAARRSRCVRAVACRPSRRSCTTGPARSAWSGSDAAASAASRPVAPSGSRDASASRTTSGSCTTRATS